MGDIKIILEVLRKKSQKDSIEKDVVGGIILKNNKSVLLLKRARYEFYGGFYDYPSGKVEEEEDWYDALAREIKEETGLKLLSITDHVGNFDYLSSKNKKTRQNNFLVNIEGNIDDLVLSEEHQSFIWHDLYSDNDQSVFFDKNMKKQLLNLKRYLTKNI